MWAEDGRGWEYGGLVARSCRGSSRRVNAGLGKKGGEGEGVFGNGINPTKGTYGEEGVELSTHDVERIHVTYRSSSNQSEKEQS